jgi:primosomal protein N' (replication factor Y)
LVARVVPDVTGLDKEFDYLVPDALRNAVDIGTMVRVPLAGRRVGGWVVAVGPPGAELPLERLRPLAKVSGHGPPAELVDLARWASWRWAAGRVRPLLRAASPPGAVVAIPAPARSGASLGPVDPGAARLLAAGGGVLRRPPAADPVPVVLAAVGRGPTLVVVPGVDEARLLGARLRRAGLTVAVVPRDWASAAGGVDVVIGARLAAWAPVPDLAAVVVLDEHDEALQEERVPTWHARDVVLERARRRGAPCLLVSPVPSLTALQAVGDGDGAVGLPSRNEERAGWPILEVVDRSRDEPWKQSLLSTRLLRYLHDPDCVAVCVLNAPGRARRLACRSCRALQRCERCQAAVTQTREGVLRCARCGLERPVVCQSCGSSSLVALRPGVTALAEQVAAAAGRPAIEVTGADADPPDPSATLFVGTEAVLHRVPRADMVAFLDFDAELLAPRFRADEEALTLLARAARLVGPRADGGRLLVQTRLPHHEVIDAVLHADPGRLVGPAMARRAELGLPPVRALAVVSGAGADELAASLREAGAVAVNGPADGRYLARAPDAAALADALAAVPRPAARVRVEVDPPRV